MLYQQSSQRTRTLVICSMIYIASSGHQAIYSHGTLPTCPLQPDPITNYFHTRGRLVYSDQPGENVMLSRESRLASLDTSDRAASVEEDAALDRDSGMLYSVVEG